MQINQYQQAVGNIQYRSKSFRQLIETHLSWLNLSRNKEIREIPSEAALRWRGDFYGLLSEIGVESELHWVTLRLNGYRASTEFADIPLTISVPDKEVIRTLLRRQINSNTEL